MKTLLVLGATSDIAKATAYVFAQNDWNIILAGRHMPTLEAIALDMHIRTERFVQCVSFDADTVEDGAAFWDSLPCAPQAVLCAVGYLGVQEKAEQSEKEAQAIMTRNFTGLMPMLSHAANVFEEQQGGSLMVISSVAGDRGRASNYVYGAAKAGLTAFLSGLRQRLYKKNVQVMTIKPGFVDTAMTDGMALPALLTAAQQDVAKDIYAAFCKKKNIVYSKWFWKWIMHIITMIPECMFVRIKL